MYLKKKNSLSYLCRFKQTKIKCAHNLIIFECVCLVYGILHCRAHIESKCIAYAECDTYMRCKPIKRFVYAVCVGFHHPTWKMKKQSIELCRRRPPRSERVKRVHWKESRQPQRLTWNLLCLCESFKKITITTMTTTGNAVRITIFF